MTAARPVCVVVAGAYGSGTSPVAEWLAERLADAGFRASSLSPPNGALRINRRFLAALGRRWCDPDPLPEGCFSESAATQARAEIGTLLDQLASVGGDVLLQDVDMARMGPLWLGELKARFEPLVVVRVLSRADAALPSVVPKCAGGHRSIAVYHLPSPLRSAVATLQSGT